MPAKADLAGIPFRVLESLSTDRTCGLIVRMSLTVVVDFFDTE